MLLDSIKGLEEELVEESRYEQQQRKEVARLTAERETSAREAAKAVSAARETHDDAALHDDVGVLVQPDLDPRLGLKEPEDEVLRASGGGSGSGDWREKKRRAGRTGGARSAGGARRGRGG